jgi:hypothetical protein
MTFILIDITHSFIIFVIILVGRVWFYFLIIFSIFKSCYSVKKFEVHLLKLVYSFTKTVGGVVKVNCLDFGSLDTLPNC